MADTVKPDSITDVRCALVAESTAYRQRSRPYYQNLKSADSTQADFDAYEGLAAAGGYAWVLAAVLRHAAEVHPESAEMLARVVGEAMNSGLDWLEGANDDLAVVAWPHIPLLAADRSTDTHGA